MGCPDLGATGRSALGFGLGEAVKQFKPFSPRKIWGIMDDTYIYMYICTYIYIYIDIDRMRYTI